ncbi:MAG: DUF2948 family protein [Xanthobacteraceae bacterium]|nr:MAG: DUF2948 family protein [Xanthobacteraceae bacterium]
MTACKLIALDADDLIVVSAHVQEATVRAGDIHWRPQEKRLVVALRRPDWDEVIVGHADAAPHTAALRFDRVLSCRSRQIDLADTASALELLAIRFEPGTPPGGQVTLYFAGGAALRLEVECLECELADLA